MVYEICMEGFSIKIIAIIWIVKQSVYTLFSGKNIRLRNNRKAISNKNQSIKITMYS